MQNVFSTPLAPILVLWIGAIVFYVLDRFLEPQDGGVAEAVVLILAAVALVLARSQLGRVFPFGQALAGVGWQGTPLSLVIERTTWILALILLCAAGAAALASLVAPGTWHLASGTGRTPIAGRSGRVAALGATLLFLFGKDWATMALAWVLIDVFLFFALEEHDWPARMRGGRVETRDRPVASSDEPVKTEDGAVKTDDGPVKTDDGPVKTDDGATKIRGWTAFLSLGGAVALGLALILWQSGTGGGEGPASLSQGGPLAVVVLAVLAAVLRLLPYPLPGWWGESGGGASSPVTRLIPYLVPALSGAYLWTRLSGWNVVGQGGTEADSTLLVVLSLWAGLAMLVSALKAWLAANPGQLINCTALYGIAFILLGAGLGLPASWQRLVGASACLSVCGLYVSWTQCQYLDIADRGSYWRVAPTGVAVLSLVGLPLTVGFPARVAIYDRLFEEGQWLALLLVMVAEAGLIAALLRVLLDVECVEDGSYAPGNQEIQAERALDLALQDSLDAKEMGDAERALELALQNIQGYWDWLREIGYGAGVTLALGIVILGLAPGMLGAPGLGTWLSLPRLHVWAALFLAPVGAISIYRSQERFSAWVEEWRPLIARALDLSWAYRAVEVVAHQVRSVIWSGSQVVEGAGYMAWVTLFCLVVLLLVLARRAG